MKTWKKIVLGVSLISLFLGGGLVAWGYSQGGLTDLQNKTISEQDYVKKEVDDFSKIDIKSSSYNVLIKNGDVDKTLTKQRFLTTKKQKIQLTHL